MKKLDSFHILSRSAHAVKNLLLSFFIISSQSLMAQMNQTQASDVVAMVDSKAITYQVLDQTIADKIYQAQKKIYDLRLSQLNNTLLLRFIGQDPYSQGMSPQVFLNEFVIKDNSVSQKDVTLFIKANKIPQEKINDDLKKEVHQYLVSEIERKAVSKWFKQQSKKHGVVINLVEPQKPKIKIDLADAAIRGNEQAPITIVEFSDFQCPYCAKAEKTLRKLLNKYPQQVQLVYRNFPLGRHPQARIAAEAGLCAKEQSSAYFWSLHDKMFADPGHLKVDNLKQKAAAVGLNSKIFDQCLESHKYDLKLQMEINQAQSYGVNSTPVFFVNGVKIVGNQPIESFEKIIQIELANLKK